METISSTHMNKKLLQAIRKGNTHYFYTSWTWRKKRKQILSRDNHECQECKKKGKFNKADTVHHIKELKEHPELGLIDNNLISLCNVCHNIIHERFAGQEIKNKIKIDIPERW